MIRTLALGVALVMIAVGCGPVGESDAGRSEDSQVGAGRGQETAATARFDVQDGDELSLGFAVGEQSPSVVVAEAVGASVVAYAAAGSADSEIGSEAVAESTGEPTGEITAELANPTEAGGPLVFQLVETDIDPAAEWFEVLLPIRPNGTTGWVHQSQVTLSRNPFRIEIDIAKHRLSVYKANSAWLTTTVAIGTGDTPTPVGRFYVTELLRPPTEGGPYGPFAFGLSGFSETLTNYAGGQGVVGIHGTDDPGSLGTDVSHGCVRMANETIETLAGVLPLGTPVLIRR